MSTADEDRAELSRILAERDPIAWGYRMREFAERMVSEKSASERRPMGGELMDIGRQMANVCYNLAQTERLPKSARDTMADLHKQWDAAVQSAKAEPVEAEAQVVAWLVTRTYNKWSEDGTTMLRDTYDKQDIATSLDYAQMIASLNPRGKICPLYTHPASIDDIRRAAADLGYMVFRWTKYEIGRQTAAMNECSDFIDGLTAQKEQEDTARRGAP